MDDTQEITTLTISPLTEGEGDFWNTLGHNSYSSADISTISLGNTVPNVAAGSFTIGGGGSGSSIWHSSIPGANVNWANVGRSNNVTGANVHIQGNLVVDGPDIVVGGKSVMALLDRLEERLAWMQPNLDLEAEWDELRELGDRYRALEAQCREKADMWNKLKAMPPVKLDF